MSWNCKDDQKAAAKWPLLTGRCSSYSAAHLASGALWAVVVAACSVCVCVICLREKAGIFWSVFDFHACDHYIFLLVGISLIPPPGAHFIPSQWIKCIIYFFLLCCNHFISLSDNRWRKPSLPPMSAKSAATIKSVNKLLLKCIFHRSRCHVCLH